jgi:hypothetical protein
MVPKVIDVADAESEVEEINAYIAVDALIVMYDRPDVALDCADTICPFVPADTPMEEVPSCVSICPFAVSVDDPAVDTCSENDTDIMTFSIHIVKILRDY